MSPLIRFIRIPAHTNTQTHTVRNHISIIHTENRDECSHTNKVIPWKDWTEKNYLLNAPLLTYITQAYCMYVHMQVAVPSTHTHVGHVRFVYICVTPVVLTPNRCEIPRCHGCACDLLVRVRDLCAQATKSLWNVTSVHKTVRCVKLTFGEDSEDI